MSTIVSARRTAHLKPVTPRSVAKKAPYGDAQARFIATVRSEIDSNPKAFFGNKDWSWITSPGGVNCNLHGVEDSSLYADTFYVKDLAVWIPHLLIPNFRPSCPTCETNKYTSHPESNLDWISRPKILYGLSRHRYLDTVYYLCKNCSKKFTGYNEASMHLDAKHLIGLFNYRLGNGYAIDDELYSFIISHSNETTASIYHRLGLLATDKWIDDSMFYYKAVTLKKVSEHSSPPEEAGKKQTTIDSYFEKGIKETSLQKKHKSAKNLLASVQRQLDSKVNSFEGDVDFIDIFRLKENRNQSHLKVSGRRSVSNLLVLE